MRMRIFPIILLLVTVLASSGAWADFVTYTSTPLSIGPSLTDWGPTNISVPQWDPSTFVGYTLAKVTLTYDGTVVGTIQYENEGSATTVTGTLKAEMHLWDPDSVLLLTATPLVSKTDALPDYDLIEDFAGLSGRTYTNVTGSTQEIWWTTGSPYLTMFSGSSNVTMTTDAEGKSIATGGGNVAGEFVTNAGGSLTVRYDYDQTDIPEPCTLALGALGLMGVGLLRGRRRRRSSR